MPPFLGLSEGQKRDKLCLRFSPTTPFLGPGAHHRERDGGREWLPQAFFEEFT